MRFLIILFLAALPTQAFAQEEDMLCTLLSIYQPADDVAYQEGVDVNGNPVVPADLNAAQIELPSAIKIPLQMNMAKRLERLMAINLEADAQLGLLEVYENGRVTYQGKNITNSAAAACALSHREEPATTVVGDEPVATVDSPQSENGQTNVDLIQSDTVKKTESLEVVPDKERDLLYGEEHKELN